MTKKPALRRLLFRLISKKTAKLPLLENQPFKMRQGRRHASPLREVVRLTLFGYRESLCSVLIVQDGGHLGHVAQDTALFDACRSLSEVSYDIVGLHNALN